MVGQRNVFGVLSDEDELVGEIVEKVDEEVADFAFGPVEVPNELVDDVVDPVEPAFSAENPGHHRLELHEAGLEEGDLGPELPFDLADSFARYAELAPDPVEGDSVGVERDDFQKTAVPRAP